MTQREQLVANYFAARNKYTQQYSDEASMLKNAKSVLDMLGATWTRGKTDDTSGVADLLICYNGLYVAIECKDDHGMPTPQQLEFIAKVKKSGGRGAVCRSISDMFAVLVQ